MTVLVLDPLAEVRMIEERQALGLDRYDEVWDGVYVMSPLPENNHQVIVVDLVFFFIMWLRRFGVGFVYGGCNVSDRNADWTHNYRCPDVAVYLSTTKAIDRGTHWQGGPDFAVEILSENDRTWDKLDFYAKVNTRELLIVERNPWKLSLLRLADDKMKIVGASDMASGAEVTSESIPFSFRLVHRHNSPAIEMKYLPNGELGYAPEMPPLKPAT